MPASLPEPTRPADSLGEGEAPAEPRNGPARSGDGQFLFYSEVRFNPSEELPYPFNVQGAVAAGEWYLRIDDAILANVNTAFLE